MARSNLTRLFACALIIAAPAAAASDKDVASNPVLGKATGVAAPTASLENAVSTALVAPMVQGRSVVVMSPVNTMRVSIQEANGVREVLLIEHKTRAVKRNWTIDATTTNAAIATISDTVLSELGLGRQKP